MTRGRVEERASTPAFSLCLNVHTSRTLWSFIIQSRPNMPDEIGGLVWYGPDSPIGSVWLPVYASSDRVCDLVHFLK